MEIPRERGRDTEGQNSERIKVRTKLGISRGIGREEVQTKNLPVGGVRICSGILHAHVLPVKSKLKSVLSDTGQGY